MTKRIKLTQGKTALVDDCDFERISKHKWFAAEIHPNKFYAIRQTGIRPFRHTVYMHREVLSPPDGLDVDHISREHTLDNRRSNLRQCTKSQNQHNRGKNKNNKSGFKGVSYCTSTGKWFVQIMRDNKKVYIGSYSTVEEAAHAYDKVAKELHGKFSWTNFN